MNDNTPLWMSQRGSLMAYALTLYAAMLMVNAYAPVKIDSTALGVIGMGISLGFAWFYKDKAAEAVQKIAKE